MYIPWKERPYIGVVYCLEENFLMRSIRSTRFYSKKKQLVLIICHFLNTVLKAK